MIKVSCPAKINLTIEIVNKRDDGFHNIKSIMQTVSLCDYLTIDAQKSEATSITLSGTSEEIPYNEKNLVYFELTSSREVYNKLIINPKPDSLLRVAIHIKKVDKEVSIKEQKLKTFERKGFAAIEWGGVIH